MAKFDVGGSPAAPYFGPGGRQEATEKAKGSRGHGESATAGPAEAAKEATKRARTSPENLRTKADPASTKATEFDTKSKNAAETGQGEPVGDPVIEQPGTAPREDTDVKVVQSTTAVAEDDPRTKKEKKGKK